MAAARASSRYGHRDSTLTLIGYRHGLRASELVDLQWHQVELTTGRLRSQGQGWLAERPYAAG
jgi:site-specific recombinase XerC